MMPGSAGSAANILREECDAEGSGGQRSDVTTFERRKTCCSSFRFKLTTSLWIFKHPRSYQPLAIKVTHIPMVTAVTRLTYRTCTAVRGATLNPTT